MVDKKKFNIFLRILKHNEVFFIDEEYVIFYELDPTNISNDKRTVEHKSIRWAKCFGGFSLSLYAFLYEYGDSFEKGLTFNLKKDSLMWVVFYYIDKYNIKYIIKKNFFKRFYYFNLFYQYSSFK